MTIKTVTTNDGVNAVTFDEFYKYFWIKNKGTTTVNVSGRSTIATNTDNTAEIAAGESVMVENYDDCCVYVLGAGKVEIHAQNYIECPFEFTPANGGGGTVDEQARADIADINARVPYKILTGIVSTNTSETKITFSEAFETVPTVMGTIYYSSGNSDGRAETCHTTAVSTTGTTFETRYITASSIAGNGALSSVKLHWIAIGT